MNRADFVIKRTAYALVTILVAVTLNFFLFRVVPGDDVAGLRCQSCTPQFKAAIRHQYGLDKPKFEQYFIYLDRLGHGDLGTSVSDNQPAWDDIKSPLVNTLPMIVVGTLVLG